MKGIKKTVEDHIREVEGLAELLFQAGLNQHNEGEEALATALTVSGTRLRELAGELQSHVRVGGLEDAP